MDWPLLLLILYPSFLTSQTSQYHQQFQPSDGSRKMENPTIRKGLDALTSSLNQIGGSLGTAFEVYLSLQLSAFCCFFLCILLIHCISQNDSIKYRLAEDLG